MFLYFQNKFLMFVSYVNLKLCKLIGKFFFLQKEY